MLSNLLRSGLLDEVNKTTTENGMFALKSTGSKILDLYAVGGSIRHQPVEYKYLKFDEAFAEDNLLAVKLLFHIRDVRGGMGERDTFRIMLKNLAIEHPDIVIKNMYLIPFYGRYDDLYSLIDTGAEDAMWEFMRATYDSDLERMGRGENITLMAKWVANPSSSSKRTAKLGRKTVEKMGFKKQGYVTCCKNLAAMRKYLGVPEIAIAAKQYSLLDYSKIASKCMLTNKNLFIKYDNDRFEAYIRSVQNGEQKINTGTITPGDIIRKIVDIGNGHGGRVVVNSKELAVVQALWDNLDNYMGESSALVMLDTSASMTWCGGDPIINGLGLSIYCAQRCKGPFKNSLMTFSSKPDFLDIEGLNLPGAVRKILGSEVFYSTNVMSAYDLILKTAIKNKVSQEDMPDAMIIVSDMQFDQCNNGEFTLYSIVNEKFTQAGYEAPRLVMWNVRGEDTMQAKKDDTNVTLVSGTSSLAFKHVMDAVNMTPYESMLKVLNSERYAAVTV